MKSLTKKQAMVKELRIVQGKTLQETAKIMGVSIQRIWQIEQEIYAKEVNYETN